jgi:hypothetical protein
MRRSLAFLFLFNFSAAISAQTDIVPPTMICKQILGVLPTDEAFCWATIHASDLIDTVFDDSEGIISLGIRKICTGSGFPENMSAMEQLIGDRMVEV